MFCYDTYQMTIWAMNIWNWEKNSTYTFYFLNKADILLILNMLYLQAEGIVIDCITLLWYWDVETSKHEILKPKKFGKILRNELIIYALILNNKNEDVVASIIFYKITDYIDVFFKKNAEKLSEHKESDYVIELNEQDLLFESLYNLSSSELKIL